MAIITVDLATGEVTQREMTPEEVAALPPPPPPPTPAEQIAELERQSGAPKWMRALALGLMEKEAVTQGAAQGLNATQSIALLRAGNPGYRRLKEIEEQIAVLEALL